MPSGVRFPDELDGVDWARLHGCGGPATATADLIREIHFGSDVEAQTAWEALFDSACHQGATVYEVTPSVIPFIAGIALSRDLSEPDRLTAVRFLALAAMAPRFTLADRSSHHAEWRRGIGAPPPSRDLAIECREAVGRCADAVLDTLVEYPLSERAWYLALAAAVYEYLGEHCRNRILTLPRPGSSLLLAATDVLEKLLSGASIEVSWLQRIASLDEAVHDELRDVLTDSTTSEVTELARLVSHGLAVAEGDTAGG